jgi:hypothetical protein
VHVGGYFYNVADFFIIGCTPLFLLASVCQVVRAARQPASAVSVSPPARSRLRARARMWIPALAAAVGLICAVALGAANYGGVNAVAHTPVQRDVGSASMTGYAPGS